MATNFSGGIVASDGFKISIKNTPMDIRTRIESLDEILSIPNPFIGMIFYVSGEDQFYVVKTLKPKSVGAMIITDALIDQYEPLHKGLVTIEELQKELEAIEAIEGPQGPEGPAGADGQDGQAGKDFTYDMFTEEQLEMLKDNIAEQKALLKEGTTEVLEFTPELQRKAAEQTRKAIIDMADDSNKMGVSMESIMDAYKGFSRQNFTINNLMSVA